MYIYIHDFAIKINSQKRKRKKKPECDITRGVYKKENQREEGRGENPQRNNGIDSPSTEDPTFPHVHSFHPAKICRHLPKANSYSGSAADSTSVPATELALCRRKAQPKSKEITV